MNELATAENETQTSTAMERMKQRESEQWNTENGSQPNAKYEPKEVNPMQSMRQLGSQPNTKYEPKKVNPMQSMSQRKSTQSKV